jgi:hypothetical protein
MGRRQRDARRAATTIGGLVLLGALVPAAAQAAGAIDVRLDEARLSVGSARDIAGMPPTTPQTPDAQATGVLAGGLIADDGKSFLVPQAGIRLPAVGWRWGTADVRFSFAALGPLSGEIDAAKGTMTMRGRFDGTARITGLPAGEKAAPVTCSWSGLDFDFGPGPVSVPTFGVAEPIVYPGTLDNRSGAVVLAAGRATELPPFVATSASGGSRSDVEVCSTLSSDLKLPALLGMQLRGVVSAPGTIPYRPKGTPRLRLRFSAVKAVPRGRTARVTVRVTNTGSAEARNVKLAATAPGTVAVTNPRKTIKRLRAKRSATVTFRIRTTDEGSRRPLVRVTSRAEGVDPRTRGVRLRLTR